MPGKTRKIGSRRQVWNGSAEKTVGGLQKGDLTKNKYGRIVSTLKQKLGRKQIGGEHHE